MCHNIPTKGRIKRQINHTERAPRYNQVIDNQRKT